MHREWLPKRSVISTVWLLKSLQEAPEVTSLRPEEASNLEVLRRCSNSNSELLDKCPARSELLIQKKNQRIQSPIVWIRDHRHSISCSLYLPRRQTIRKRRFHTGENKRLNDLQKSNKRSKPQLVKRANLNTPIFKAICRYWGYNLASLLGIEFK